MSGLPRQPAQPSFAYAKGLRRLLVAIFTGEPDAWATHPEVPALVRFCEARYALMARRYGQTPADAASAAFEVLRRPSTLDADDPWGFVTRAVQRTLQAADRADRLLCSVDHARRLMSSGDHDVERFCDLAPEATVPVVVERAALTPAADAGASGAPSAPTSARETVTDRDVRLGLTTVRTVMVAVGWLRDDADVALEYVCNRLRESESTTTAFESLRRDLTPLHLLDLDHPTWTRLCRALLGEPGRPGILAQAVLGARPVHLLTDARLLPLLAAATPAPAPAVRHA